jgi:transposase-like protein
MPVETDRTRNEVPLAERQKIKRDYLLGKGPIRSLCEEYGVNPGTAQQWAEAEKWTDLRKLYAMDDVLTLKDQIRSLDEQIAAKPAPKDLDSLFRAKQRAFSMVWGLTGHPKPPTGKPPKERSPARDALLKRLYAAAREEREAERQAEAQIEHSPPQD